MRGQSASTLDAFRLGAPETILGMLGELLEKIEARDGAVHAFVPGDPDRKQVQEQARDLMNRFPDPETRPPLFCVPVGVKDIYRIQGRFIQCGSLLPPDLFEGKEASLVTALRKAGAIIMGRTTTTEFAYFEPAATSNPHSSDHTPGGSSSGSAAGVAAGFFPLALGTQTVGSIIRPASYCGVTGFKPSFGRLPTQGLVYFSPSVDHAGLFCTSPAEAAAVMSATCPDWRGEVPTPHDVRIGIPVGPYLEQASEASRKRLRNVVATLENLDIGVEVLEIPCLEEITSVSRMHNDLIAFEMAREHSTWFRRYRHLYRPRTAELIEFGLNVDPSAQDAGRRSCSALRLELHEQMDRHGLDAWICPASVGEAEKGLSSTGSPAMNLPWTHAGMPALTLPLEQGPHGLPLGIQLVARFGEDEHLLGLGQKIWIGYPS